MDAAADFATQFPIVFAVFAVAVAVAVAAPAVGRAAGEEALRVALVRRCQGIRARVAAHVRPPSLLAELDLEALAGAGDESARLVDLLVAAEDARTAPFPA